MIVRKTKRHRNFSIRLKDGSVLKRLENLSISEKPKYTNHIGVIPVIKNIRSLNARKNDYSTTGVYSLNIFLENNNNFPTIPYIKRNDMDKHIRIYMRKKYNVKKSDIDGIHYVDTRWGLPIYILIINNMKNIRCRRFWWRNYCIMYDNSRWIESIYDLILSENKSFLNNKMKPKMYAPEVSITVRELCENLELWYTSGHREISGIFSTISI